jgi:predicted ATPase
MLKGVAAPIQVHQVMCATEVQQRFDVVAARGLTPLVGREHEVGILRDRWAQVQAGRGHIVVLSGEAGIGKSRLVQVVKDEIIGTTTLRIEYRCSPYHQHSALYPVIAHLTTVKAVAQLGAVLGRTFSYEVLQAVTPLDEASLQQALARLVDAELLYQRGVPPQATYLFKHGLIQDTAYQSLLKSTRQQFHQRIAHLRFDHF